MEKLAEGPGDRSLERTEQAAERAAELGLAVRSCDYSRVAVAEVWVGEQEVAAAAVAAAAAAVVAGQYKEEGP